MNQADPVLYSFLSAMNAQYQIKYQIKNNSGLNKNDQINKMLSKL